VFICSSFLGQTGPNQPDPLVILPQGGAHFRTPRESMYSSDAQELGLDVFELHTSGVRQLLS
jgi:hypothetical protein